RMIENQPVITNTFKASAVQRGDVIVKVEGEPVKDRLDKIARYFTASPAWVLESQLGRYALTVRGQDNAERNIPAVGELPNQNVLSAHRSGEAIRMASEKIGYADMERVEPTELDAMFEKFAQAKAIIFDLRGYPRDNALAIAARLGSRN